MPKRISFDQFCSRQLARVVARLDQMERNIHARTRLVYSQEGKLYLTGKEER